LLFHLAFIFCSDAGKEISQTSCSSPAKKNAKQAVVQKKASTIQPINQLTN
jgi:hypothetical protein